MSLKVILLLAILIVFILFGAFSFKKNLTPYVDFDEAKRSLGVVQVIGELVTDRSRYDLGTQKLYFTLKDKKGKKLLVSYTGPKPANFEDATNVVAIGKYGNGEFVAEQVLVKCPSKYQGEKR
jgi:cytochrome c-type biogenesis protein CcmE